jgi:hypothetical protein
MDSPILSSFLTIEIIKEIKIYITKGDLVIIKQGLENRIVMDSKWRENNASLSKGRALVELEKESLLS